MIKREEIEKLNSQVSFLEREKGRKLSFYEYGAPDGRPIIFCHGTGAHVHVMLLDKAAREKGYRIIVPDRPGIGRSDPEPGRTILGGARDIAALADHLGIKKFGVMGISGGGPTVFACAYLIPDRLDCAVDLAGAVPLYTDPVALKKLGTVDRISAVLGARMPLWMFAIPFSILGYQQKTMKNPKAFADMMRSSMCKPDMDIFLDTDMQYLFMRDFQELFRQGSRWAAQDAQLIYKKWEFSLRDLKKPIYVRQGTEDKWIPPFFSEYVRDSAPGAKLDLIQGQGHFYHMVNAEETLAAVDKIYG